MRPTHRSTAMSCRAAAVLSLLTTAAYGDAVFDFNNGNPLDSVGVGATMTVLDTVESINVTVTTVDVVGQDGSLASEGTDNLTNSTSSNALGINSVDNIAVDDEGLTNPNDPRDFDPGEQWIFTFDGDVELVEIDFSGWTDNESEFTLSFSDDTPDIVLIGDVPGDTFSLSDTPVAAGVEITMGVTNVTGDRRVRVPFLTVAAVPAPPTGDNLVWAGADGDAWNTVDANFTGDDTVFSTGDNVEIQTAGAINIDAGGITAGAVTDTTAAGTVTLQTGNLTAGSFGKSGAGMLLVASPISLDTGGGVVALSGGTLQVANGATLSMGSISVAGGSTLQVDSGAALNVASGGFLDEGGGILSIEDPFSIGFLSNSVDDVPFTKAGSGALTMTGDLGVQSTGPVELSILGGSLTAASGTQLNLGGNHVLDGDVILEGSKIEFHGSTVSGTGSIIAQSGTSTIDARFQGGMVNIANNIVLNSDIALEAPTNGGDNSELFINGTLSGIGNVVKDGNGLVVLTGTNTYTGTTTVESGTLAIGGGPGSMSGTLGLGAVSLTETSSIGNLEFQRDDSIVVDNLISGVGNVIINGGELSSVELNQANDYTGDTVLEGGTLLVSLIDDAGFPSGLGAGSVEPEALQFRGGALSYVGDDDGFTDRTFLLGGGGGTISADGAGSLSFNIVDDVGVGTGTAPRTLTLGGTVPKVNLIELDIVDGMPNEEMAFAVVSVTKTGSTTWSLIGANTYTGDTAVEEGTLSLGSAYLADASGVSIATGAVLDLPHGEADTVTTLSLDGSPVMAGTYGSTAAVGSIPGAIVDDVHFTGSGYLVVTSDGASDYDSWAAGFGLVGGPTDDDDLDGVSNEDEYAFGLDPTSGASVNPIAMPLDKATGELSYTRRNPDIYGTGLNYSYGSSTNLDGTWTPFTPDSEVGDNGDPVETVTITVPAALLANDELFIQVLGE